MIIELYDKEVSIRDNGTFELVLVGECYSTYTFEDNNFLSGIDIDTSEGVNVITIRSNNLCIIDKRKN